MVPKGDPRESKFTMLLSDEERDMLMAMALDEGMSAATWLRRLIRHAYGKRETPKAPKRAKRK